MNRCPYCDTHVDPVEDQAWWSLPSGAVAHYGCQVDAERDRAEARNPQAFLGSIWADSDGELTAYSVVDDDRG